MVPRILDHRQRTERARDTEAVLKPLEASQGDLKSVEGLVRAPEVHLVPGQAELRQRLGGFIAQVVKELHGL